MSNALFYALLAWAHYFIQYGFNFGAPLAFKNISKHNNHDYYSINIIICEILWNIYLSFITVLGVIIFIINIIFVTSMFTLNNISNTFASFLFFFSLYHFLLRDFGILHFILFYFILSFYFSVWYNKSPFWNITFTLNTVFKDWGLMLVLVSGVN